MSSNGSDKAAMKSHVTDVTKEHILELFELCRQFDSETVCIWDANFVEEYEGKNEVQRQLFCVKTQMELLNTFGDLFKDKETDYMKLLHNTSTKMTSNDEIKTVLDQVSQATGLQFGTNIANASQLSVDEFKDAMEEDFKANPEKYEALLRQFANMPGMSELTDQFMEQSGNPDNPDDEDEHPPDNEMADDES